MKAAHCILYNQSLLLTFCFKPYFSMIQCMARNNVQKKALSGKLQKILEALLDPHVSGFRVRTAKAQNASASSRTTFLYRLLYFMDLKKLQDIFAIFRTKRLFEYYFLFGTWEVLVHLASVWSHRARGIR